MLGTNIQGFSETFATLEPHVPDRVKRFRLCVRVKRGIFDTAQPGALNIDQAYFRGAMELMQHADEIDLLDLYLGQLAWEDLPKCRNYGRRQVVRLPKFLDTEKKLDSYRDKVSFPLFRRASFEFVFVLHRIAFHFVGI